MALIFSAAWDLVIPTPKWTIEWHIYGFKIGIDQVAHSLTLLPLIRTCTANILNHFIHWFFTRIFVFFTMLSSRLPTPREVLTPKPYLVWNWHRIQTRVWIQGSASWLKGAGPSAAVSMGTEFRLVVGDSSLGTRVGQISYWAHRRYSSGCQRISFEFTSYPMQVSAVRKLYADVDIRWSLKRTRERVCVCVRE